MSRIGHAEKNRQNPRILRGSCSDKLAHCLQKSGLSTHPFTVSRACIALSAIQDCWTQTRKHNAIENHQVFMVLQGRPALLKFLIKIFQKIAFWKPKSDHSLSIQWIPTGSSVRTKRRRPPEFSSWSSSPAFRLPNLQVPKQDATRIMRRGNKQTMKIPNACPELATLRKTDKIHGFW